MNAGLVWSLVALGLATVVVRRRSAGIVLVTVQSLALAIGAFALAGDRSTGYLISCVALLAKAAFVGAALGWSLERTREQRPVRDGLPAPVRFVIAIAIGSGTAALVPSFGLPESAGNATVALVGIGAAIVLLRRATIFQALGLVVAENGVAIGAASARDGLPLVVELGFAFDVLVLIAVVLVVHERIFGEFGTGDTRLLRGLRDR
jgi:hydrogenase-4 component E